MKKTKAEGSGYSNAGCTSSVGSGAKYEWQPGPASHPKFKSVAREVETSKAKKCLLWGEEVKKGNTKHAEELLQEWKLTKEECMKVVDDHACWDWVRKGESKEAEELGYKTEEECVTPAREWQEEDLKEPVILETTTGARVECLELSASGEYSGSDAKRVSDLHVTFVGCRLETEKTDKGACQSAGASEGEIVVNTLEGELGLITKDSEAVNDEVGIDLFASSGPIAKFECPGASFEIVVTGSLIHAVTTNKMVLEENEKFDQSKGVQIPENFAEGEQDVLWSTINGVVKLRSGEALLSRLENEEKIEVNTVT